MEVSNCRCVLVLGSGHVNCHILLCIGDKHFDVDKPTVGLGSFCDTNPVRAVRPDTAPGV